MKKLGVGALALAVISVVPLEPARGLTSVANFSLSSDGTEVFASLPQGAYLVTVSGTYDYDNADPSPLTLADAECTTPTPHWRGVVDQATGVERGLGTRDHVGTPLPEWQRHRFGVRIEEQSPSATFFAEPTDDVLDVYINGKPQSWVPAARAGGDGRPAPMGCDTTTHTYSTPVVVSGGYTRFRIYDVEYSDNRGSLAVTVESLR